ncbi:50S ribosomal protein L3 glutamine methyltransferase [Bradyrhizobium ivorense]|uniref:50S ribosomal protein L3 glutamine methyltransferase n=2 Tax=Bradyrhizobium ivorense TaxID=2511166 RepID=A0A508TWQ2_9BRAD|nr:50S ribosomal protein L3 glutamine methyltransferase [Bradyrhizobium ivorense]
MSHSTTPHVDELTQSYKYKAWNDVCVYYTEDLNGGGAYIADDYLDLFNCFTDRRRFKRMFEWCCGPAFIGYSMLAANICASLCLADFYGPAIEAAQYTADKNNIGDRVTVYKGDGLLALPESERFDLVVGNPPHFVERNMLEYRENFEPRIYVDDKWRLHRDFFSGIREHLERDGLIVLVENTRGSHIDTFKPMIQSCGLMISGWQWSRRFNVAPALWYLFIMRDDSKVQLQIRGNNFELTAI